MGIDRDEDTVLDGLDNCPVVDNLAQLDTDGDAAGNACDDDDDGDGLLDTVETDTGLYVDENDTGTDPLLADSDADGFDDAFEISAGTDPNDPYSFPGAVAVPGLRFPGATLLIAALCAAVARSRRGVRRAGMGRDAPLRAGRDTLEW
jgi:hypothetical protein